MKKWGVILVSAFVVASLQSTFGDDEELPPSLRGKKPEEIVVVTGFDMLTPYGVDVSTEQAFEKMLAGESAVRPVVFPKVMLEAHDEYLKQTVGAEATDLQKTQALLDHYGIASRIAGQIDEFKLADYGFDKERRRIIKTMYDFSQYAWLVSHRGLKMAGMLDEAGYLKPNLDRKRFAVVFGTGQGGGPQSDAEMKNFFVGNALSTKTLGKHILPKLNEAGFLDEKGEIRPGIDPGKLFDVILRAQYESGGHETDNLSLSKNLADMAASQVGKYWGLEGEIHCPVAACATGAKSLLDAYRLILHGYADYVIAGSVEATRSPVGLNGFNRLGTLSVRNDDPAGASRPYDKGRDGFVFSEGAGMAVLENLASARKRGAKVLLYMLGGGNRQDPPSPDGKHDLTKPGPGLADAAQMAMDEAKLRREDIHLVSNHATGTEVGDVNEALMNRKVYGENSEAVHGAHKSLVGHQLGASGSVSFCVTAMALLRGETPGIRNLSNPIPEIGNLRYPNKSVSGKFRNAIIQNAGFGGKNIGIAVGR